ncbi:unnamed protein product [Umbelopsis ramanniana]
MKSVQYGVTQPVSEALPTQRELELNEALTDVLAQEGMIESEKKAQLRKTVLFELDMIINEFVYTITAKLTKSEQLARNTAAKLFTYGSYRLGAHTDESDIDTLCVCPQHITQKIFFHSLPPILKNHEGVQELTTVTSAFVPVIKMIFHGIHIDLIYARLWQPTVPANLDLSDERTMKQIDESCVRTANGPRTATEILSLVPNVETFCMALKCIKLWAKRRAIYSNAMGYFGGVAWAILVARVCQLYPNGCPATIISRFFRIFFTWSWPSPVLLKYLVKGRDAWDSKSNKHHIMPILTPAYPSMCSTHNVSYSTKKILLAELNRASKIVDTIILGTGSWQDLFTEHDFFKLYKYYIRVSFCASEQNAHISWCGRMESRLRKLITSLEVMPQILIAHPLCSRIDETYDDISNDEIQDVAFNDTTPNELSRYPSDDGHDLDHEKSLSHNKFYITKYYIGLLPAHGTKIIDVDRQIRAFIRTEGYTFKSFDQRKMGFTAKLMRRSNLPGTVLEYSKDTTTSLKRTRSQVGKMVFLYEMYVSSR